MVGARMVGVTMADWGHQDSPESKGVRISTTVAEVMRVRD